MLGALRVFINIKLYYWLIALIKIKFGKIEKNFDSKYININTQHHSSSLGWSAALVSSVAGVLSTLSVLLFFGNLNGIAAFAFRNL